tara:strand:- start:1117 stop:1281 length:165 start_codon:yes stop_codon:yes gene_type:complete
MNFLSREKFYWIMWFILIILWNYGYPNATPLADVVVAVILSIFFIILKNVWKKN